MSVKYIRFREYANKKLDIIKEERLTTFDRYVMANFGKLKEDVSQEELYKLAKQNDLECGNVKIVKNATYNDKIYDYLLHDDRMCVGVNSKGKIIYIDNYIDHSLLGGKIMENKDI